MCEDEELDPSRVDEISWCQAEHVLSRPLGQMTSHKFTVTTSVGIRNLENRVAEIVVREMKSAKPDTLGCSQAHEVW